MSRRVNFERVSADRRPAMRRGSQPDHLRGELDQAVIPIDGFMVQCYANRHLLGALVSESAKRVIWPHAKFAPSSQNGFRMVAGVITARCAINTARSRLQENRALRIDWASASRQAGTADGTWHCKADVFDASFRFRT